MSYQSIEVTKEGGVGKITLNRPDVLNALNAELIAELDEAAEELVYDDEVGVVVITGAGDKAFAAGADIGELVTQDPLNGESTAARGQDVLRTIETLGKPTIAAVNGFALGGGCELAMACTIRYASEKAKFGQPEVNLGVIPGYAGTQRLSRIVGKGVALDMILTGRIVDAEEALRVGLVTRVTPHEELMNAVRETADVLLAKGPLALAAAMDVIDRGFDMQFDDACALEASRFGVLCASEDMKEGMNAFLEKRKPGFKGK